MWASCHFYTYKTSLFTERINKSIWQSITGILCHTLQHQIFLRLYSFDQNQHRMVSLLCFAGFIIRVSSWLMLPHVGYINVIIHVDKQNPCVLSMAKSHLNKTHNHIYRKQKNILQSPHLASINLSVQILQCFPTGSTNICMFSSNFDIQYYIHKVLWHSTSRGRIIILPYRIKSFIGINVRKICYCQKLRKSKTQ